MLYAILPRSRSYNSHDKPRAILAVLNLLAGLINRNHDQNVYIRTQFGLSEVLAAPAHQMDAIDPHRTIAKVQMPPQTVSHDSAEAF